MNTQAVIFDLDGVIVSTDDLHYRSWQKLADAEGIEFNREINERCRGVSRMESLEIVLEKAKKSYSPVEKVAMAARKNATYGELLKTITSAAILPGVMAFMDELKKRGIKVAVGSSSKNTINILKAIGLRSYFHAIVDGNDISNGKPDPEIFLVAAKRMGIPPANCLVVEDAEAGVTAALAGGMRVLAVGFASNDPRAQLRAKDLAAIGVDAVLA